MMEKLIKQVRRICLISFSLKAGKPPQRLGKDLLTESYFDGTIISPSPDLTYIFQSLRGEFSSNCL